MSPETSRALRTATWRTILTLGALVAYVVLLGLVTRPAHGQQRPTAVFNATCTGLTCTFSGQGSSWPNGHRGSDARVWDFGDGTVRGGPPYATIVSRTYAAAGIYQVRYTITDTLGLSDDTVRAIAVGVVAPPPNQPPIARFAASCSGLTCRFDGSPSTDDVAIVAFSWRFGDSSAASGPVVSHAYAAAGRWTVELYVNDSTGAFSVARLVVTSALPIPPGFAGVRLTVPQGLGRAVLAYRWFFGDGTRAMTQDTLVALVERHTGRRILQRRLSEIERAVGAPPESAEAASLSMTLGLLFALRADSTLPATVVGHWQGGISERRRRGLP